MGCDEGCMEGKKRGFRKGFLKRAVSELRPEASECTVLPGTREAHCDWCLVGFFINMS